MKFTIRNIAGFLVARYKIVRGKPNKIIQKCINGEIILSLYSHRMNKKQLKKIILWFKKKGISFIHLDELKVRLEQTGSIDKGKAILTFDDGWSENISIMELANKMKVPICIFLTTGPMEEGGGFWWSYVKRAKTLGLNINNVAWYKKLENKERIKNIEELKKIIRLKREALQPSICAKTKYTKWVSFGAHTINHPILTKCDYRTMQEEISISTKKVETWTGKNVKYFAYPNGDFGEREVHALSENDVALSFTTHATYINPKNVDALKIPRCEILEDVSLEENICRATATW